MMIPAAFMQLAGLLNSKISKLSPYFLKASGFYIWFMDTSGKAQAFPWPDGHLRAIQPNRGGFGASS